MFKELAWDSTFFGFKVGEASLSDLYEAGAEASLREARARGLRLAYLSCRLEPDALPVVPGVSMDFAEKIKADLADIKVWYGREAEGEDPEGLLERVNIWEKGGPVEDLYPLALQSGIFSRFKLDEKMPPGTYERLYRKWTDNSLNGEMADFLVYKQEKETISGFITVKLEKQHGIIELLAVDEHYRGQRIGQKLIGVAGILTRRKGRKEIWVATQYRNRIACRFYEKNGYRLKQAVALWHWWI